MYKCTIYDTTRFKAVMVMNLSDSAVKRASARAILRWVSSWEVWFGEPKADNIVSLGVCRYNWYSTSLKHQWYQKSQKKKRRKRRVYGGRVGR
jgi:cobalamin biosynthesis protein CobT